MTVTKAPGTWTYEDLLELPDDGKRWEIIDGEPYEMPSPNWDHQTVLGNLFMLIAPEATRIGAKLRVAPLDVILSDDHRRVVQPDLLLIAVESREVIKPFGVEGAPDLVIEILSPSNTAHDQVVKRRLYFESGVREYWIVDPESRIVEVLVLDQNGYGTLVNAAGRQRVRSPVLPELSFPAEAAFEA